MRGDGSVYLTKQSSVYYGKYYLPGNPKPQRFSTGEREQKKALKVLRKRVALVLAGRAVPEEARNVRYDRLEQLLLDDYRANQRRSLNDLPRVLRRLREAFVGVRAIDITTAQMVRYRASRLQEDAAASTINKELAALGRMLSLAFRLGLIPIRPAIPKLRVQNARTGFLEPDGFEILCAELPADLQPMARFAYLTGWRRNEVLGLQWRQVDLKAGVVHLEAAQSKNGRGRVLPFAADTEVGKVLAVQAAARRLDCSHVFHRAGRPIKSFYGAWRSAARRAGFPGLTIHDFRRSAVRNLVRAGVSEHVAMGITGHKTRAIFDRYDIVSETDLRIAATQVSYYLRRGLGDAGQARGRGVPLVGRAAPLAERH